jgi:hypothetical protein
MLAEIPILEDKSADWNVEQATFDYIVPSSITVDNPLFG